MVCSPNRRAPIARADGYASKSWSRVKPYFASRGTPMMALPPRKGPGAPFGYAAVCVVFLPARDAKGRVFAQSEICYTIAKPNEAHGLSKETAPMDVKPYVEGMRQRARLWERQCEQARRTAREDARRIASYLIQAGASKVVLFGSLLPAHGFTPLSDIDLAVEGLTWPDYWRVLSAVRGLTSFDIDLVMLEDASPELHQRIFLEGEMISDDR